MSEHKASIRWELVDGEFAKGRYSRRHTWTFDGGVDWEGTFVDTEAPNLLTDLPPAVLNFPDYVASGLNSASASHLS